MAPRARPAEPGPSASPPPPPPPLSGRPRRPPPGSAPPPSPPRWARREPPSPGAPSTEHRAPARPRGRQPGAAAAAARLQGRGRRARAALAPAPLPAHACTAAPAASPPRKFTWALRTPPAPRIPWWSPATALRVQRKLRWHPLVLAPNNNCAGKYENNQRDAKGFCSAPSLLSLCLKLSRPRFKEQI